MAFISWNKWGAENRVDDAERGSSKVASSNALFEIESRTLLTSAQTIQKNEVLLTGEYKADQTEALEVSDIHEGKTLVKLPKNVPIVEMIGIGSYGEKGAVL
jgi:hypothetical protein